jgi:sugar O-acyltransferase (sialic acid O-acetyltransferase NeuD family)
MNKEMNKVVLFGTGKISEVAYYYLLHDSNYDIVAFTVEQKYLTNETTKFGKPVVPFEELEHLYPPAEYKLFAPFSGSGLNKIRERLYLNGKQRGYKFISYISSKANIFTEDIGENCFILENNTVQPYVKIGDNCILWSGNHIGHHSTIEDHVFITSHVVISGMCTIKKYSYLGVNSALKDNIILNEGTVIGMSASVTKNTEGNSIYIGLPAKLYKHCDDTIIL